MPSKHLLYNNHFVKKKNNDQMFTGRPIEGLKQVPASSGPSATFSQRRREKVGNNSEKAATNVHY